MDILPKSKEHIFPWFLKNIAKTEHEIIFPQMHHNSEEPKYFRVTSEKEKYEKLTVMSGGSPDRNSPPLFQFFVASNF